MAARKRQFDVSVVGGGPAGFAAAISAARHGARTLLLERHPVLGGMGTAALVNNFCAAHWDGTRMIIGGIFAELRTRLLARKALYPTLSIEPYDPEVFAEEVRDLCRKAGVQVLLRTELQAVSATAGGITIETARGVSTTRTLVDATGDAVLAHQLGVASTFGRVADGAVMPLTFCYEIGPIDVPEVRRRLKGAVRHDANSGEDYVFICEHPKINALIAEARRAGTLAVPKRGISGIFSVPGRPAFATVNFGRVDIQDPTDPKQLCAAEAAGRAQIEDGVRFFRTHLPGFDAIQLQRVARQIGVRQSRQIKGRYRLTAADVIGCRQFRDVIAQCCYAIDIHEPGSDRTTMHALRVGTHYDIPLRALIPRVGPKNVIVAGRSISATHEAMSSFRVSPTMIAVGEAAGITAALASRNGGAVADVPAAEVQRCLRVAGAILI